MKNRLHWIDIIRGTAILLVMLGHTYTNSYINGFIYSFHIPLFFYLSGYLYKVKNISFIAYVKKIIKKMIVPGLIYGWLCYFIEYIFRIDSNTFVSKILGTFFELRGSTYSIIPWFLITITFVEVIFYVISKYLKKEKVIIIILVGLIVNYIYLKFIGKILPWGIDITMLCLSFFSIGFYTKNYMDIFLDRIKWRDIVIMYAITVVVSIINLNYFVIPDIYAGVTGNILIFFSSAIFGIFATFALSKKINKLSVVEFIGQNSIIFYSLHGTIYKILNYYIFDFIDLPRYISFFFLIILTSFIIYVMIVLINNCKLILLQKGMKK